MSNIKNFKNFNNKDIFTCIKNNNIQSIKNYIYFGYDLNVDNYGYTPLIYVSISNQIEIAKLLLNAGADVNKQNNIGSTALIYAAYNNNIEIVKLLLNSDADIDKQNSAGRTALMSAAYNNNREIIELLLDYYADEFTLDYNNKSFYDYLNDKNKQYFLHKYPTSVYNAISHNYKKSFTEFVKDYNIKIKK